MQKLVVLGFMPPIQSIADPTPRFNSILHRTRNCFWQLRIDHMVICLNSPQVLVQFGPGEGFFHFSIKFSLWYSSPQDSELLEHPVEYLQVQGRPPI